MCALLKPSGTYRFSAHSCDLRSDFSRLRIVPIRQWLLLWICCRAPLCRKPLRSISILVTVQSVCQLSCLPRVSWSCSRCFSTADCSRLFHLYDYITANLIPALKNQMKSGSLLHGIQSFRFQRIK
ncbi:hypothetical protein BT96DRAFT_397547 [Gymnopus androsaceus JB14]|uniref:Uncharacterized protein n=1 Tax=Gymnopus androsaceus JB14 TaxID=1447944 RepID=A0A6A4I639_9AGAR|nr:hypothetical protein BT96DRAFT_397547 [Gymnopus androsaceus JB14]